MIMPSPYKERHDSYMAMYQHTREKRLIGVARRFTAVKKDGSKVKVELSLGEIEDPMEPSLNRYIGIFREVEGTSLPQLDVNVSMENSLIAVKANLAKRLDKLVTDIDGEFKRAVEEEIEGLRQHVIRSDRDKKRAEAESKRLKDRLQVEERINVAALELLSDSDRERVKRVAIIEEAKYVLAFIDGMF